MVVVAQEAAPSSAPGEDIVDICTEQPQRLLCKREIFLFVK